MPSVAVFVDAGYLFAQGSAALTGAKKVRADLTLNETAVLAELRAIAMAKSPNLPLLRVYWYDAARGAGGMATEHARLAFTDFIKLRLGVMNNFGQQKGVDSLIITDLIELARNRAISDAVLLSGDEDLRVGVQIAQSYGVRVHLLGIIPSRGSQSAQLMQEADTTTEWDAATVGRFLSVAASSTSAAIVPPRPAAIGGPVSILLTLSDEICAALDVVAESVHQALTGSEIADIQRYWQTATGLPSDIDRRLLPRCRAALGQDLDNREKRYVRAKLSDLIGHGAVADHPR